MKSYNPQKIDPKPPRLQRELRGKKKVANYNHKKIEAKWQKIWEEKKIYNVKDFEQGKENFYHLVMFPYPSGNLHIGHWYNFAPADVYARFKKPQNERGVALFYKSGSYKYRVFFENNDLYN